MQLDKLGFATVESAMHIVPRADYGAVSLGPSTIIRDHLIAKVLAMETSKLGTRAILTWQ